MLSGLEGSVVVTLGANQAAARKWRCSGWCLCCFWAFFPGNRKMSKGSLAKGISPETRRWFCKFMACRGKKRRAGSSVVCSPTVKSYISKSCLLKILTVVILLHTFLGWFSGYMMMCIWVYFYAAFVCSCRVLNFFLPLTKSKILQLIQPFWNKTFVDIFMYILYLSLFFYLGHCLWFASQTSSFAEGSKIFCSTPL